MIFRCVILISIVILFSGCQEEILHNLSETEANGILTRLHDVDIRAQKNMQPDGLWTVAVKSSHSISALSELSDARVFRKTRSAALSSSMLPSRDAQRFEYERALSQEVEITLEALEGVLEARVHLNLPLGDPLLHSNSNRNTLPSASVLLISDHTLHEEKSEIASLVGGASGINRDRISVIIAPTEREIIAEGSQSESATVQKKEVAESSFAIKESAFEFNHLTATTPNTLIEMKLIYVFILLLSGIVSIAYVMRSGFLWKNSKQSSASNAFAAQLANFEDKQRNQS